MSYEHQKAMLGVSSETARNTAQRDAQIALLKDELFAAQQAALRNAPGTPAELAWFEEVSARVWLCV